MPKRNLETIENSDFYTTLEASLVLGVSIKTIQEWTKQGKIKEIRTKGNHRRIPKSEIINPGDLNDL